MWTLFTTDDLKRLSGGVALACAAGLLMGAAFQPNLDERDTAGPQMLMGEGGARKMSAGADAGVAVYEGRLPEYVVGTDWARSQQPPQYEPVTSDDHETVVYLDPTPVEDVEVSRATWVDEPRGPVVYPSMNGSADYEANLPPAPEPPGPLDEIDAG